MTTRMRALSCPGGAIGLIRGVRSRFCSVFIMLLLLCREYGRHNRGILRYGGANSCHAGSSSRKRVSFKVKVNQTGVTLCLRSKKEKRGGTTKRCNAGRKSLV